MGCLRIDTFYNTALGKYGYTEENFQLNSVQLNQKGRQDTNNQGPNYKIAYNSFKAPTEIYIAKPLFWRLRKAKEGDRISFEYNPLKERSKITYGNTLALLRTKTKVYTADKAFEMKRDNKPISPDTEIVAYIDGDPYSASYIQKTSFKNRWLLAKEENLYLHRDYQQSILAISNAEGKLVEQRRFDAWGNIEEVRHIDPTNGTYTTDKTLTTLDRGYTGHEHLQSVGLVNMNGRVYDPSLRRFLGPDNFVQDPFNTQNFNRYGYVLNNPLMYTDPSGEVIWFVPILIGAAVGILTNGIMNVVNGGEFWWGMGKAGTIGAVSGAISAGIGSIATSMTTLKAILFQAGAHGVTGGLMNVVSTGNTDGFLSGFASGVVSSLVSSGLGRIKGIGIRDAKGHVTSYTPIGKSAMIAAGGISGGISSTIAGGDFSSGLRQGLITAGLNHAMHEIFPQDPGDPKPKKAKVVDSTADAVENYYSGDGSPVELGASTKKELLNDTDYKRVLGLLKSGDAKLKSGHFDVHFTKKVFHIGDSNVNYSTSCSVANCTTNFSAFTGDGFWDPLDMQNIIGRRVEIPLYIEGIYLTPKPFNYTPYNFSVSYPNPGYPAGINIK